MSTQREERVGDDTEVLHEEEDLEEVMREASCSTAFRRKPGPQSREQVIPKIPEAVDDYLRNFLLKAGLRHTLSSFETDWYGFAHNRLTESLSSVGTGVLFIPDALTHRELLKSQLETVHGETDLLRQEVLMAWDSLVKLQREREFYQMQYQRVTEDKNKLMEDFKQLKRQLRSHEPALRKLNEKYQAALTQKMLISLEKDQAQSTDRRSVREKVGSVSAEKSPPTSFMSRHPRDTQFPTCSQLLKSHLAQETSEKFKSANPVKLSCSIRAHYLPISCISLHPQKQILATTSDDRSWRLWVLPGNREKTGEMVLTGEGHSDWLSGCSFHPDGAKLATTSGDTTVRLWDLSQGSCMLTLPGHTQPTWGSSFHWSGHFLASCSADKTGKLWDLNSERCRLTLHHHTASVNSICFLPCSNLLLTCSADKTLALWDARLGVCTATFRGHQHACNHTTSSPAGNMAASCDASGIINLWDIRTPALPIATVDAGPEAVNQTAFSQSGKMLAVACSDGVVRLLEVDSCVVVSSLLGHRDAVQSVTFDHKGETIVSAGSNGMIHMWS